jgi:hypothetical protein
MQLARELTSFLDDHGVHYKTGRSSLITTCINPACGKEEHMWVRRSTGRSICYKCNERWDWRGLVSTIARVTRNEAYGVLFGFGAGDELAGSYEDPFTALAVEIRKDKPITFGLDMLPAETSEEALAYLESRHVQPQQVLDFDIKWNGSMRSVIFPVCRDGVMYGWQGRRVKPDLGQLKTISTVFNKSNFLMNWDRAKLQNGIAVVEGPFDCTSADVEPGVGAAATLGKGLSQEQINMLLKSPAERLYIGLDPDAFEEVYELVGMLGLSKKVFRVRVPEHRADFGECLAPEVTEMYKKALPMTGQSDVLEVYFRSV